MGAIERAEVVTKSTKRPLIPSPPPPPPRPRWSSYTRREIERFWMKKRLEEEEHLLAAIKAAARLRATHLSEEDYLLFIESLEEDKSKEREDVNTIIQKKIWGNNQEIRVGIKDWWTKSKYAYLNQPVIGNVGRPIRRSYYKPDSIIWFYHKSFPTATAPVEAIYLGA